IPRWRIVGSLAWARAGAGLSVTARYLPSYDDATFDGVPTGRTIPSQTLVDAQATLDLDGVRGEPPAWLQGLKIALGASNLFDKEPPFSEAFAYLGYDVTQGELRGRFLYARLSK